MMRNQRKPTKTNFQKLPPQVMLSASVLAPLWLAAAAPLPGSSLVESAGPPPMGTRRHLLARGLQPRIKDKHDRTLTHLGLQLRCLLPGIFTLSRTIAHCWIQCPQPLQPLLYAYTEICSSSRPQQRLASHSGGVHKRTDEFPK
jgi:hypothetical protein